MTVLNRIFILTAFVCPLLAQAQTDPYFDFVQVKTMMVEDRELKPGIEPYGVTDCSDPKNKPGLEGSEVPGEGLGLSDIINIGMKLWQIMVENKPVVTAQWASASALPANVACWNQLGDWKVPRVRTYRTTYANGFGMTMVDFTYRLIYTYGGSYQGKGAYLSNVQVFPAHLSVGWGYTFDAKVSVPSVVNTSSRENPVAGMQVVVDWTVKTPLKYEERTASFFLQGTGVVTDLE